MTDTATAPASAGQAEAVAPSGAAAAELGAPSSGAWYGNIKDAELRTWMENKNFPDQESAIKSHRSLETMMGKDRLSVPDPDKMAEWDGWDKLGAPKEAIGYKDVVKVPELPEGMVMDEALMAQAFEMGAKERIPVQHMQKMLDLYAEHQKGIFEHAKAQDVKDRAELDALYTEWGGAKERNIDMAKRGLHHFGLDASQLADMNALLGSAKLMDGFYRMGKAMSEGGLIGESSGANDPATIRSEMERMKADPEIVASIMDPTHPSHKVNKQRWDSLQGAS